MASSTDKLLTLPTGVKASIVAVVMIFVAAGWYLGFYVDLVDGIKSQKVTVSRLTKTLEEQRLQEKKLNELEQVIDGLRTERNRMSSALPDTMDLDDFLQSVENAALAAGIKLVEFVPQPQESTDLYLRIPIKLRLIGTYGEVVSFFDALRALERIVNVENVDLKAKRESETRQLVEATCLATTFMYKEQSSVGQGGTKQ